MPNDPLLDAPAVPADPQPRLLVRGKNALADVFVFLLAPFLALAYHLAVTLLRSRGREHA
jgi:hypothetical protein